VKKHQNKQAIKRRTLELKKETIVRLDDDRLKQAVGGAAVAGTTNSACCVPTWN
jgi:hypothetical protein